MTAARANALANEAVNNEMHEVIFARAEGATIVPFSHSLEPVPARAYAPLRGEPEVVLPITAQDVGSLRAVLKHIAHSQDMKYEVLQAMVEMEFSVDALCKIPQDRFHQVMEFLIDMRVDSVRSRR